MLLKWSLGIFQPQCTEARIALRKAALGWASRALLCNVFSFLLSRLEHPKAGRKDDSRKKINKENWNPGPTSARIWTQNKLTWFPTTVTVVTFASLKPLYNIYEGVLKLSELYILQYSLLCPRTRKYVNKIILKMLFPSRPLCIQSCCPARPLALITLHFSLCKSALCFFLVLGFSAGCSVN